MTETPETAGPESDVPASNAGLPAGIWVPGVIVILAALMWVFYR